jgi:hypothetical protein
MNKNESDALLELERMVRIVVYQTVEKDEIEFWRESFKKALESIAKIRERENAKKEALKVQRAWRKNGI